MTTIVLLFIIYTKGKLNSRMKGLGILRHIQFKLSIAMHRTDIIQKLFLKFSFQCILWELVIFGCDSSPRSPNVSLCVCLCVCVCVTLATTALKDL